MTVDEPTCTHTHGYIYACVAQLARSRSWQKTTAGVATWHCDLGMDDVALANLVSVQRCKLHHQVDDAINYTSVSHYDVF